MSRSYSRRQSGSLSDNAWKQQSICKKPSSRLVVLALLLAIAVTSGCSGDKQVPVFPVSGRVTFKGQPPVGAQVLLHAAGGADSHEVAPTGIVEDDGSFQISSYKTGDGAPRGDYIATIQWFKMVTDTGGSGAGPNVLPQKYASPQTSPIKVSVNGGPTEIPPITIANN